MGELLLDEDKEAIGAPWSVERRFRVTEVFLAVLWVCIRSFFGFQESDTFESSSDSHASSCWDRRLKRGRCCEYFNLVISDMCSCWFVSSKHKVLNRAKLVDDEVTRVIEYIGERTYRTPKKEMILISRKCCASAYLSFYFTDCLMSRW
jgi:hypothetical protein